MQDSFFRNKYLIFILFLLSPMVINLGGEVSPSLLFIASTSPFWVKNINFNNDVIVKDFTILFLVVLFVQIVWFPFAKTDDFTQIKGLLITISGLMHFLFYYFIFRRDVSLIKWAILGTFIANFIFIDVLAVRAGDEYGMWKFHTYPHIVTGCVLFYIWFCEKKWILKLSPLLLILIGLLGLFTGSRSAGLIPLISGLFAMVILSRKNRVYPKQIIKYAIISVVSLYAAYAFFYVPNVLNGKIEGGNTLQLKRTENPYNPINLLMIGRTDAIIPFIAFADKPLTGWGYMTKDPDNKYHRMLSKIGNREERNRIMSFREEKYIPGHSVIGYYACSYGIVVFVALLIMLFKIWKYVVFSMVVQDKYLLYRLYGIISITWHFLFSPMSHFKWLETSTIAIVLVISLTAIKNYNKLIVYNESKNISNNSNIR